MMRARGLDFSQHQLARLMHYLVWKVLGFSFAWVRLSIGSLRDTQAAAHIAGLRAQGYLLGGYHALHEAATPRSQARLFAALLDELLADGALPAMLDVERENLAEWHVTEFLDEWTRVTRREIAIYTSANSWHQIVGRGMRLWARRLKLWVAGYTFDSRDPQPMDDASVARRSNPPPVHLAPLLPDLWGLPAGSQPAKGWEWWQHTGHGSLLGYHSFLDMNVFNGTVSELLARYGPRPVEREDRMQACAHVLGGGSADALQLTLEGRSKVVKLTDGWGDAATYAAMPHRPLVVGRRVVDPELRPDHLAEIGADPVATARTYFANNLREHVLANPAVAAWEGPNEVVCKTPAAMRWYAAFEAERVRLLAALGKKAVVGNFSVGQPEPELWVDFAEALDAIRLHGGYLGLHEYSEPSRGWDTWYVGRFTRAPRDVPKIIGEFGTDSLPPVPEDGSLPQIHPPGKPWKGQFGNSAEGVAAYAAWIWAMELRYRKHADVVGVCLYTLGREDLWPEHNVEGSGLVDRLLAYNRGDPEDGAPPVIIEEGAEMLQYVIIVDGQVTGARLRQFLGVDLIDMRICVPVDNIPSVPPPPAPSPKHTMGDKTNQYVINLFNRIFSGLATLEGVLTPAQRATLYGQRQAAYSGPAVEDMALTDVQKVAVIAALGQP